MAECVHELPPETCDYCRLRARRVDPIVYISPKRVGHLDGCTHKENDNWTSWGQATTPGAWRDLCNRTPITANAGAKVGAVAERACRTCVESDRNS